MDLTTVTKEEIAPYLAKDIRYTKDLYFTRQYKYLQCNWYRQNQDVYIDGQKDGINLSRFLSLADWTIRYAHTYTQDERVIQKNVIVKYKYEDGKVVVADKVILFRNINKTVTVEVGKPIRADYAFTPIRKIDFVNDKDIQPLIDSIGYFTTIGELELLMGAT